MANRPPQIIFSTVSQGHSRLLQAKKKNVEYFGRDLPLELTRTKTSDFTFSPFPPAAVGMGCASSKPEEDYDSAGDGLGGTIGNEAADEVRSRPSNSNVPKHWSMMWP